MLSRLCVFMPLGRNVKGFKYWWMRENWPPWHIFWTCRLFIFLRWKGFRRMEWARAYTFTHARVRTEKKSKRWVDSKRGGEKWKRRADGGSGEGKRRGKPQNIRILKIADILRDWKMNWGLWPFARFNAFLQVPVSIFLLCSSFCLWFLKMKSAILNNRAEGHVISTEYSALQSYFTNSLCNFSYLLKNAKYVSLNYCNQKPA